MRPEEDGESCRRRRPFRGQVERLHEREGGREEKRRPVDRAAERDTGREKAEPFSSPVQPEARPSEKLQKDCKESERLVSDHPSEVGAHRHDGEEERSGEGEARRHQPPEEGQRDCDASEVGGDGDTPGDGRGVGAGGGEGRGEKQRDTGRVVPVRPGLTGFRKDQHVVRARRAEAEPQVAESERREDGAVILVEEAPVPRQAERQEKSGDEENACGGGGRGPFGRCVAHLRPTAVSRRLGPALLEPVREAFA